MLDPINRVSKKFINYKCSQCKSVSVIGSKDQIRCKECGNRILYKLRSSIPSEYLAR
jgi:DNA-directed RNA polymerase subunit RPC12/RpoP